MDDNFGFGDIVKMLRYAVGFIKDFFGLLDEYAAKPIEKLNSEKTSRK